MKLNYRPEIDGLRAIAVVAVIFYHAEITVFGHNFFKGGYIGVDIFFVISGYLITSLILKELKETNKFSFLNFYERRARRILPVLFFIMAFSIPFAYLYLLPSDFLDFAKSILLSIGFSSNLYFYFTGLEYGATESFLKPFLHTWSLSVEEQFYIIFPSFLLIGYNFFKNSLLKFILITFLLSLLLACWSSYKFPSVSFYFLHTRMWELLAGSILAYYEITQQKRTLLKKQFFNNLLSALGIFLIIYTIIFFDESTINPSLLTLIPIVGICLVIWFSNKNDIVTKILSSKFFVFIGLTSYSLYLWHYPAFAFFRYSLASGSLSKKIILIIFIIVASSITYFFIEKPFRNKEIISLQNFKYAIFSFFFLLIFSNIYIVKSNGFDNRYVFKNLYLDNGFYREEVINYNKKNDNQIFKSDRIKVLIIGNSHGRDLFNSFKTNENIYSKYEFSRIHEEVGCIEYLYTDKNLCNKKTNSKNLDNFFKSDVIILSTKWKNTDKNSLDRILNSLKKTNKKIFLTTSAPEFGTFGVFTIMDKFIMKNKEYPNENEIINLEKNYFDAFKKNESLSIMNKNIRTIAKNNDIIVLDKSLYQCSQESLNCNILTDDGEKIYYDNSHYTIAGAKFFGKKMIKLEWLK